MNKLQHWAIFLSNKADKNLLICQLLQNSIPLIFTGVQMAKGVLFSSLTINNLIEEESRLHTIKVAITANRQLKFLSGGEQKKALLHYLLIQKPDFIIADNPFDNLDTASFGALHSLLNEIAQHTTIIQLVNRSEDYLHLIKNIIEVSDLNEIISYPDIDNYFKRLPVNTNYLFKNKIPPADQPLQPVNNPLIKFNDVTIKYEERVIVKNIIWQINTGEFWHLTGANGAGKTTLLLILTGDNVKGYGQDIELFGKRKGTGETVWELKQLIGYFTASVTELFSRYTTVEQMIISGYYDSIGLYTKPSGRQIKLAHEWLNLIGMQLQKKLHFHTLSLGQQRMIVIVRAMVKHPALLILDEPTVGLDDDNTNIVVSLINKMAAESTTAILYVSHRKENGLNPTYRYTLTPGENGSVGKAFNLK